MTVGFPRPLVAAGVLASLIWLPVVCLLAERFNIPSGDGILYSLPLSATSNPLRMGVPFLGDFLGYGSAWGHNWPGSMWVKAIFFSILPYSRVADVALLSCFQLLAAWVTAGIVWKACGKTVPSVAAFIVVLSDRLLGLSCMGNRFETIAVAAVLLMFFPAGKTGRGTLPMAALAFLCPALHPYSLVMAGIIAAWHFVIVRKTKPSSPWPACMPSLFFLLGCGATVLWFVAQPVAAGQFTANLEIQRSFYQNWNQVLPGLGNYRLASGIVLWVGAAFVSLLWFAGWPSAARDHAGRFLTPVLFLSVVVIHTATRCENFHYLAFGSPFALIMLCATTGWIWNEGPRSLRFLSAAGLAGLAALHALLLPVRLLQFKKAGMPDIGASFSQVLDELPPGKTVHIPHPMWAAAVGDKRHTIRWFTFPIASRKHKRETYEKSTYENAKPGDILIIDNGGAGQPDRFGLYPTFATNPPDPLRWKHLKDHKQMFQGSIAWGIDLSVYEYRGAH